MALFEEVTITLITPLVNLWNSIVDIFPGIIGGLLILIIGYFMALVVGHALRIVLEKAGLDKALEKVNLPKAIGRLKASSIFGIITKWYIFLVFMQSAVDAMNLGALSLLLTQLVLWLPQLIIAVLAVFAGLFIAHYVSHIIELHSEMKGARLASKFFNGLIIFLAVVIALEQIGLEVAIVENAFLILLGSAGLGFALAIGLSFGLGAKEEARDIIVKLKKKL